MEKQHSHICSVCEQEHIPVKTHKESLTKIKASMLKVAAAHVIATGSNDFKKSDLPEQSHSEYANFQKLRYHGLIAQVSINGEKTRDRWAVTRNGWAFLRGDIKLPKFVMVQGNHTLKENRSDVLVSLIDVLKAGEYLETQFEYYDENNNMIGFLPKTPIVMEQASLL